MFEVILYYPNNVVKNIDFHSYIHAYSFFKKMMKNDNDILVGNLLEDGDIIQVISNIGVF